MAKEASDLLKSLTASTAKDREKAAKAAEKAAKAAYDHEKLLIEDYRNSAEYSIEGEIAMWEKLGKSHKEVSNEKIEIEKSIAKLREDLVKEDEAAQNAYGDALTEALKRRARQETDTKIDELKAQQEAEKQAVNDRIELIKDTEYREMEYDTDTFKGKIKLIDEEYIAKIRLTDETLAASMSAYNQEQQAIIDTIALTDEQTAKRLQDIKDTKDAILAESEAAKAAREAAAYAEKDAEYQRKIAIAETTDARIKAQDEYYKWLDEQAYKADEADRNRRIKALDDETKDILTEAKKRQDALADIAAVFVNRKIHHSL